MGLGIPTLNIKIMCESNPPEIHNASTVRRLAVFCCFVCLCLFVVLCFCLFVVFLEETRGWPNDHMETLLSCHQPYFRKINKH